MKPIQIIALLCLPMAISAQQTKSAGNKTENNKPNVLFVISDDMDCRIGCYGDPVAITPNLDRLAGMGVKFDRAYCQFPLCNPSRSSVLSGRYPTTTGVLDNTTWLMLNEDHEILPEYFAINGYDTRMFGKIFHGPNTGFKRGKEPDHKKYVTPEERAQQKREEPDFWDHNSSAYRNMELANPSRFARANEFGPLTYTVRDDYNDSVAADRAIQALREYSKGDQPFFLTVGFRKPHVPLKAPGKYFRLYDPDQMQLPPDFNTYPEKISGFPEYEFRDNLDLYAGKPFTVSEAREAMLAYYACISYIDTQLGRILDELDNLGLTENTIIVFWGDHGWHLSEKGLWAKGTLFEVSAHAPLIIFDPRSKVSGLSSPRVVQFIDIYPTLVDLCGLPTSPSTEGRSLRPLVYDPDKEWNYPAFTVQTRKWSLGRSVRTEKWRYTEWDNGEKGSALFNHELDPHEMTNLAADPAYQNVIAEMKALLDQMENQ